MSTMTIDQMMSSHSSYRVPVRPQVRLTRRGRLVVFLGTLAIVLMLGVVWGTGSVATERPGTPEPTRVVMVGPGDTLYDLAAEATPEGGDVAAMVERIQRLNALDSGMVDVGQKLRIPTTDWHTRLRQPTRPRLAGRGRRGAEPTRFPPLAAFHSGDADPLPARARPCEPCHRRMQVLASA
jgi:LysM domain